MRVITTLRQTHRTGHRQGARPLYMYSMYMLQATSVWLVHVSGRGLSSSRRVGAWQRTAVLGRL